MFLQSLIDVMTTPQASRKSKSINTTFAIQPQHSLLQFVLNARTREHVNACSIIDLRSPSSSIGRSWFQSRIDLKFAQWMGDAPMVIITQKTQFWWLRNNVRFLPGTATYGVKQVLAIVSRELGVVQHALSPCELPQNERQVSYIHSKSKASTSQGGVIDPLAG